MPGARARIQYDVATEGGSVRWCQVIDDGRVTTWERGDISAPDVEIRWSLDDAFEILAGGYTGARATLATTIGEQRPDGEYVGPPPPLDLAREPELERLRRIPDANLTLHYELRAAPFGAMQSSMVFVDGQLERLTAGLVGVADVVIELPFRQLMRMRGGGDFHAGHAAVREHPWIDRLDGVPRRHPREPAVPARRSHGRIGPRAVGLAALGELRAEESYAKALAGLMAATPPWTRSRLRRPPARYGRRVARTARLLETELEAGLSIKGTQVCVIIGDEARHLAVGDTGTGDDVTDDAVFKVYCRDQAGRRGRCREACRRRPGGS